MTRVGNRVKTENSLKKAQHSHKKIATQGFSASRIGCETRMFRLQLNQHCSTAVAFSDSFAKYNISSKLRIFSFGSPAFLSD
jgi:hypothetical protein